MNTQRREEIRAMIADPDRAAGFRDALIDAMDWIDQLEAKAAERVISNGAKYTAPDYHPEKNEPFEKAMSAIFDCHARNERAIVKLPDGTRMEFHPDGTQTHLPPEDEMPGPVPDYTGEGSAWIPPKTKPHTFAQMVKVPDITDDDFESISILMQENGIGCHSEDDESFRRIVASTWAYAQGFRAIPADRVLGEGMVQVDREEWKHIVTILVHLIGDEDAFEKIDDLLDPISKLREARDGRGWIGAMISGVIEVSTPEIDDFFVCPPSALRSNQGGANT